MLLRYLFLIFACHTTVAAEPGLVGQIAVVPLERTSDRTFGPRGTLALAMADAGWKHSETEHFILHHADAGTATVVSVEAEFHYRIIAAELGKETARWERKAHVFIFHREDLWRAFQAAGGLDPWTGGIHTEGALFFHRKPGWSGISTTLAHEMTHLVLERFVGPVPLWLNEGFAEYAGARSTASFYRARGFNARPRSRGLAKDGYVPLAELVSAGKYPDDPLRVAAYYGESEKLVRFLAAADKKAFLALLEAMGKGAKFESALRANFGGRFGDLAALEREFMPYANSSLAPPGR